MWSTRLIGWHYWIATIGIVLYITAMWVSGIMQGLMWRAYDELGFLQYSFVETVAAMHPFYLIRLLGGVFFLSGGLIMAYNMWRTMRGEPEAAPPRPARPSRLRRRAMFIRHETIEKNVILMVVLTLITVSIGGIVQIIPLFTIESTIERVDGVRPYTPLELMGRNIYVREGCYLCHSQQIRPFKDEVERYGHYSLAAESMYDKPFQWGSKRTGPDLARVGGRYSNDWHVAHLVSPRAVVPESVMPAYPFLAERTLEYADIAEHLKALRTVGVPYTDEMIANARADLEAQVNPDADPTALLKRYPRAVVGKFNGQADSHHRDGCAGRLPADAGHAGALRRPPARAAAPVGRHDHDSCIRRRSRWPRSGPSGRSWSFAGIVLLGLAAGQSRALRTATPTSRSTTNGEDAPCRPRSKRTPSPARTRPATSGTASRS